MIKWERKADIFASRIVHNDWKGFLSKGFIIEEGSRALFFENGILKEVISAGKIEMGGLLQKILAWDFGRHWEVVVCDAGDISFVYLYGGLNPANGKFQSSVRSAEGIALQVGLEMVLQLESPELFLRNCMKGESEIPLMGLKNRYFQEIQNALVSYFSSYEMAKIVESRDFKNQCADFMEREISVSLQREGFRLIQVRALSVYNPEWALLQGQKAKLKLQGMRQELEFAEREAGLKARMEWFLLKKRENSLELEEQKEELRHSEAIIDVWSRLRHVQSQDKMDRIRTEQDMAAFLAEIDTKKVLREEQKQALLRQVKEAGEDHAKKRSFILAMADMEYQYALKEKEWQQNQNLDEARLAFEKKRQRDLLEHELALKKAKFSAEREQQKIVLMEEREQKNAQEIAAWEKRHREMVFSLDRAKTQAQESEIATKIQEMRAEAGLRIREKMQAQKQKERYESLQIDLEREERVLKLRWEEEERRSEIQRKLKREQYEHEQAMQRIDIEKLTVQSHRDVQIAQSENLRQQSSQDILQEKEKQIAMQNQMLQTILQQNEISANRLERVLDRSLRSIESIAAKQPPSSEA